MKTSHAVQKRTPQQIRQITRPVYAGVQNNLKNIRRHETSHQNEVMNEE